jgi:hypothetical protein
MKKNVLIALSLLFLGAFLTSCNETEEINQIDSTEDMTLVEDILNSIEETVDDSTFGLTAETELESRTDQCVEITSTEPLGQYPNTIILDFGEGCEGPHGRMRSGMIIIEISDKMENEGAVRTVTFQDFFVDEVQLMGSRTLTNTGLNDDGLQTFNREVAALQVIFPNGDQATRDALHTLTFLEGYGTQNRFDNVVSIEGSASGTSRSGMTYSSTIVEPLIKKGNCRWISAGVKEISNEDQTISLDYGDGACNRAAVVTFEDGTTKEINLYRRWWK